MACKPGCVECCHALFGLFPLEALIVHEAFRSLRGAIRKEVKERACQGLSRIRYLGRLDKRFDRSISKELERLKIRCPFLSDSGLCVIYGQRPITCVVYGMPTLINGKRQQCPRAVTNPDNGGPIFDLDSLYRRLYSLSLRLVQSLGLSDPKKASLLISMPMVVLDPGAPLSSEEGEDMG